MEGYVWVEKCRFLFTLILFLTGGTGAFSEATYGQPPAPPGSFHSEPVEEEEFDHSATSHRKFKDIDHWVRIFEDPKRQEWQMPEKVVKALGLGDGSRVADLGAGTGYFTVHLARAVAPSGFVLAVDVELDMIEYLAQRVQKDALGNVTPVFALADHPMLPPGRLDLIFVCDTFHHIDDRVKYLKRLRSALAPGGRIAVVDFLMKDIPVGPPPDHKLPRVHVISEFLEAGYQLAEEKTFLPYQYFLLFRIPR